MGWLVPSSTVSTVSTTPLRLIKILFLFLLLALPVTAIAQPKESIPVGPLAEINLLKAELPLIPPPPETIPNSVLCNCWAYVKSVYPSLPSSATIRSNLSDAGSVAVFYYSQVNLPHYAVVVEETADNYLIEETNYHRCQKGTRIIPKNDPSLLGFFPISN